MPTWKRNKENIEMKSSDSKIHEIDIEALNCTSGEPLKGTLAIPNAFGPVPLVILVTGTGAHNRDEQMGDYKPFKEISDHLVLNGFAVIRYDDRHYGMPTKIGWKYTTADFVTDLLAVIESILQSNRIDCSSVGVIGHSEGGIIAAMAAKQNSSIRAIIGLGSPSISLLKIGIQQQNDLSAGDEKKRKFGLDLLDVIRSESDETKRRRKVWKKYFEIFGFLNIRGMLKQYQWMDITASNWNHYTLNIEPDKIYGELKCPALMLYAENDIQVRCSENVAEIARINQKYNTAIETEIIKLANHAFQESDKIHSGDYDSLVKSYLECKRGMSKKALELMSIWLTKKMKT